MGSLIRTIVGVVLKLAALIAILVVVGLAFLWFRTPAIKDNRERFLEETNLQSQLRVVAELQELFFAANDFYTNSVADLEALDWRPPGGTDLRITTADSAGWAAWAELSGRADPVRCHVFAGSGPPAFEEMAAGEPYCDPR